MSTYAELVVAKFRQKGVLVDTNLLLLLLVGTHNPDLLGVHGFKRVAQFTHEDLDLLLRLLSAFQKVVTTPHILAEVSNLAGQMKEMDKKACLAAFSSIFGACIELPVNSLAISANPVFPSIGLTDAGMYEMADEYLVLTDDARLAKRLTDAGHDVLNLNHIRPAAWWGTR